MTLKGCPRIVKNVFCCAFNNLYDLKYCPVQADVFQCWSNSKKFTKEYVSSLCKANTIVI